MIIEFYKHKLTDRIKNFKVDRIFMLANVDFDIII